LRGLYEKRARGVDNEARIEKIRNSYLKALDSLKVLKRQGANGDDGKNKFTLFVDEMTKNGELNDYKVEFPPDAIDELVKAQRESIRKVMSNGI
jgi:hypothetical protein